MTNNNGYVEVGQDEECQRSHGGPTCTTDAEFHRRHWGYLEGLAGGLEQYTGR